MWIFFTDAFRNRNTFSIVALINACPDYDGIRTAPTVFIFQEVGIFFCRKAFFKLFIDTHFSLRKSASIRKNSVDNLLRKNKGRGFLFLCPTV